MARKLRRGFIIPRGHELVGLLMIFGALLLAMSLLSYTPSDLSFLTHDSAQSVSRNLVGRFGATIADVAFQLLGLASWFLVVPLATSGWRRLFKREAAGFGAGVVGNLAIALGLLVLLTLLVGRFRIGGEEVLAGGVVGTLATGMLVRWLNVGGAALVGFALMAVGATLATRISIRSILEALGRLLVVLLRRARLAYARWSEARRKRRMREEILRKHAARAGQ
jgi:S-DNA-T family DNA segregation ATPase FtsK/SpoIIIE